MGGEIQLPNEKIDHQEDVTLKLHKEELQIVKKWVDTADVTVYKKTYTEEKQILVPVTREELIIEKKVLDPATGTDSKIETTRIPLSEDRIEVTLNPTILNDVEIFKKQYEEIIQMDENVKEEKVHINTFGDVKVVTGDTFSTV
jgi:uncharacterized protein (TIGR02271 family)